MKKQRLLSVASAVSLAIILGCGGGGDGASGHDPINFPASRTLSYTAQNTGSMNIHIYMEGGSRGESNRVTPGEVKTFHTGAYTWQSRDDFVQVKFEASNSIGDIGFASVTITGAELERGPLIRVVWNGSQLSATKQ